MIHALLFAALALAALLAGSGQESPAAGAVMLDVRVEGQGRVMMPGGRICHADSSCAVPVPAGTRVPLRIMQEKGVDGAFKGWDGVCMPVRGPECVVVMRIDRVAIARFGKVK